MEGEYIGTDDIYQVQNNIYDYNYSSFQEGDIKDPVYYIHNDYSKPSVFQDQKSEQVVLKKKHSLVVLNSRNRNKNKYPNANNVLFDLPREFSNVSKIELVSSSFPNSDHVIKGPKAGSLQNNKIRWSNELDKYNTVYSDIEFTYSFDSYFGFLYNYRTERSTETLFVNFLHKKICVNISPSEAEDGVLGSLFSFQWEDMGNFTSNVTTGIMEYVIEIKPGNYLFQTLIENINSGINNVRKIDFDFNFMFFEGNRDTDILSCSPYIISVLPDNPLSVVSGESTVNINIPNHFFTDGEFIRIVDAVKIAGIPASILNNEFRVTYIDPNTIQILTSVKASSTTTGGGTNVKAGELTSFKFLYGRYDRYLNENKGFISKNLGYREENSGIVLPDDPLTTNTLTPTFVNNIGGNLWRFNTSESTSFLKSVNKFTVNNINLGIIETNSPHLFEEKGLVFLDIPDMEFRQYVYVEVMGEYKMKTQLNGISPGIVNNSTISYGVQ